jgi:hypothetical protein
MIASISGSARSSACASAAAAAVPTHALLVRSADASRSYPSLSIKYSDFQISLIATAGTHLETAASCNILHVCNSAIGM